MPASDPVTLSAEEYAALLDDSQRLQMLFKGGDQLQFPLSPIDRDEEVATFITRRVGKMSVDSILKECNEAFGWKRTPSSSATYRFIRRLRERLQNLSPSPSP